PYYLLQPSTTALYTLSLHDALPICAHPEPEAHEVFDDRRERDRPVRLAAVKVERDARRGDVRVGQREQAVGPHGQIGPDGVRVEDRKSTRLNSSHVKISYAVFCLKK